MQSNTTGDNAPKPDWWNSKPDKDTKEGWQEAVEDYIDLHELDPESLTFSMDLVKKMIPSIGVRDKRWKKFPVAQFDIHGCATHKQLYHTIRNKLDSLINKAQKVREDAEEEAAMEKIKDAENARLEAEHKEMTDRNRQLAKNERFSKQAQIDVKSVESSSKVKV